jgi:hypothetical protein
VKEFQLPQKYNKNFSVSGVQRSAFQIKNLSIKITSLAKNFVGAERNDEVHGKRALYFDYHSISPRFRFFSQKFVYYMDACVYFMYHLPADLH